MNKLWGLVIPEQAAACSATTLSRVDLVLVEKFSKILAGASKQCHIGVIP